MEISVVLVSFVLLSNVTGLFGAWLAADNGRRPVAWFLICYFGNLVGLMALLYVCRSQLLLPGYWTALEQPGGQIDGVRYSVMIDGRLKVLGGKLAGHEFLNIYQLREHIGVRGN